MTRKPAVIIAHALVSLISCFSVACATRPEARMRCPVIEMSVLGDTQTGPGKTVSLNDSGTILVSRTPIVSAADITDASAAEADGKWIVHFTVNDDAAKRVHDVTRQHVGGNLAIVVDGKAHGTPRIESAVTGNGYQIDGLTRADAARLAPAITSGCGR